MAESQAFMPKEDQNIRFRHTQEGKFVINNDNGDLISEIENDVTNEIVHHFKDDFPGSSSSKIKDFSSNDYRIDESMKLSKELDMIGNRRMK